MLSVVIPVFNGRKFIRETVKSVISQEYDNLEIIISDDASTDNSPMIIKELAEVDKRIKPIFHKKNLGICRNVNQAVINCTGEFLLILGQDDILPRHHVLEMLRCFCREEIVAVFCNHINIDENGKIVGTKDNFLHRDLRPSDFIKDNPISSCGLIMRMEKFKAVQGFREVDDFPNYGEYDLWIRLLKMGEFKYCGSTKGLYRRHESNITNTFKTMETRMKVEKYLNESRKELFRLHRMSFYEYVYLILIFGAKYMRYLIWDLESKLIDRS